MLGGSVSASADVEGDAGVGKYQYVLGGVSELPEDTMEGVPVTRCRSV